MGRTDLLWISLLLGRVRVRKTDRQTDRDRETEKETQRETETERCN